jgi:adenylate kinase
MLVPQSKSEAKMAKRIILVGIQGSGKGTQADKLVADFGFTLIGAGDIFRWLVKSNTTYGRQIKEAMASGKLVSDELVLDVIEKRLSIHDWDAPVILDGFPRNESQRKWLFEEKGFPFDAVLYLHVENEEEVIQRMMSRGRSDDNETAIRKRLEEYHNETEPTLKWYEEKGLLRKVDAVGTVEEVAARIKAALEL